MPTIGSPREDAQMDFSRSRRRERLARVGQVLRREPTDIGHVLPFEEVVEALGLRKQRYLGLQTIPLERVVGSVGRTRDFDRAFRPTSERVRPRWERIATAHRRRETMPPIDVFKVGDLYFVEDGNHRVSVARAMRRSDIDAYVTEVTTEVGPEPDLTLADLPLKSHERVFFERVPLPPELRGQIRLRDATRYGMLAEGVEAWGFRVSQECGCFMTRDKVALAWFEEEYRPVIASLREHGLLHDGQPETEAYLDVVGERYALMRTHEWSGEILHRLTEHRR
jgi:hypothetical protein